MQLLGTLVQEKMEQTRKAIGIGYILKNFCLFILPIIKD